MFFAVQVLGRKSPMFLYFHYGNSSQNRDSIKKGPLIVLALPPSIAH
jgi:hypothetical protein